MDTLASPDTVVFIHGLWMTPLSWEHWRARYEAKGFTTLAPAWPGFDRPLEELRADPESVEDVTISQIVDHYEAVIRALPKPPIIIGHSFGGTFVQILLDRGLGAAGVGVDSATIRGINDLPWTTIRSTTPILGNPLNWHKAVMLTPKQFHYAFTNTLDEEASQRAYDRYAVPGVGRVLVEGAFAGLNRHAATSVDVKNDTRAPLLLLGGTEDHIIPVRVTEANFEIYEDSEAITAIKVYPGRSHFTVGQEGWEAVADFALDWALNPVAGRL